MPPLPPRNIACHQVDLVRVRVRVGVRARARVGVRVRVRVRARVRDRVRLRVRVRHQVDRRSRPRALLRRRHLQVEAADGERPPWQRRDGHVEVVHQHRLLDDH